MTVRPFSIVHFRIDSPDSRNALILKTVAHVDQLSAITDERANFHLGRVKGCPCLAELLLFAPGYSRQFEQQHAAAIIEILLHLYEVECCLGFVIHAFIPYKWLIFRGMQAAIHADRRAAKIIGHLMNGSLTAEMCATQVACWEKAGASAQFYSRDQWLALKQEN